MFPFHLFYKIKYNNCLSFMPIPKCRIFYIESYVDMGNNLRHVMKKCEFFYAEFLYSLIDIKRLKQY